MHFISYKSRNHSGNTIPCLCLGYIYRRYSSVTSILDFPKYEAEAELEFLCLISIAIGLMAFTLSPNIGLLGDQYKLYILALVLFSFTFFSSILFI